MQGSPLSLPFNWFSHIPNTVCYRDGRLDTGSQAPDKLTLSLWLKIHPLFPSVHFPFLVSQMKMKWATPIQLRAEHLGFSYWWLGNCGLFVMDVNSRLFIRWTWQLGKRQKMLTRPTSSTWFSSFRRPEEQWFLLYFNQERNDGLETRGVFLCISPLLRNTKTHLLRISYYYNGGKYC